MNFESPRPTEGLRVLRLSPAIYRQGQWPVAYDPVGGLQMQVWRITEQLARDGLLQTVLTSHIPGSPRVAEPFAGTTVRAVGPWLPPAMGRWFLNFGWFLGLLPELLFRAHRHDLVHVHFNHSIWCRLASLVARMRGLPVVISMNTALWGGLTDLLRRVGLPAGLAGSVERHVLGKAQRVLALTEADAELKAQETGLARSHFETVPDAIDLDRFAAAGGQQHDAARFRAAHDIPEGAHVVTYVGRISAEKGWADLPLCLERMDGRPVFLLVCGDGPDRDKLETALRRLGRDEDWRITGFVSPDEVRRVLCASDILVLPSRREAFGGVLLEAMASDLPAVAYAVGGIGEVAGMLPAVRLVEPGDSDGLADAVMQVLDSPELRSELIARGRRRVAHFAIERVADATIAAYRSVLAQSRHLKLRAGQKAE